MKATIIILAAVLTLTANAIFAGNETSSTPVTTDNTTISMKFLAPATPAEATFDDLIVVNEITDLLPVTPSEATFEDVPIVITSIVNLAPVVPTQADFEDVVDVTIDISTLAPVTPAVADFE
jgi:hypothetical protein